MKNLIFTLALSLATFQLFAQCEVYMPNITNVQCNNNGTLDESDDYLTFDINTSVMDAGPSGMYNIILTPTEDMLTVATPFGPYSYDETISITLPNGSAGDGDIVIAIEDVDNGISCNYGLPIFNIFPSEHGNVAGTYSERTTQTFVAASEQICALAIEVSYFVSLNDEPITIEIYADNPPHLGGTLIGSSDIYSITKVGIHHVSFPSCISLTPGLTYGFSIIPNDGANSTDDYAIFAGKTDNPYMDGDIYLDENFYSYFDMAFAIYDTPIVQINDTGSCSADVVTCDDGIMNGDETGVDCGGSNCDACCLAAGTPCDDGDPCTSDDVEDGNCNCAGVTGSDIVFDTGIEYITSNSYTNENEQFLPPLFPNAKIQILVTNNELVAAGFSAGDDIIAIEWYVDIDNTPTTNFDLYLDDDYPSTDLPTDAVFATGSPTLVGSNLSDEGQYTGWHTATLDAPFIWDGTDNLVIQVCRTGNSQTTPDRIAVDYTDNISMVTGYNHSCSATEGYYSRTSRPSIRVVSNSISSNDADEDGVCDALDLCPNSVGTVDANGCVLGCTDATAHNFDMNAQTADNSCMTCDDGIMNGDETDVDCGGSLCNACPTCGVATGLAETNLTDVTVTLTWDAQDLAEAYKVVGRRVNGPAKAFETTQNSMDFYLMPNTTYEWTVKVLCDGVWTTYPEIREFTTLPSTAKNAPLFDIFDDYENTLTSNIYPNPATNEVNVIFMTSVQSQVQINVIDITGRLVMTQHVQSDIWETQVRLDISDLQNGYYFVEVNDGTVSTTSKLNVMK